MATAEQIQRLAKDEPDKLAKSLRKALVDFGYGGLSLEDVLASIKEWAPEASPEGVIQMFVFGWLNNGTD